jgi:hypothetical protein
MNCPKCGFQQDEGPQCLRCGLIFARYHGAAPRPRSESHSPGTPITGLLRRFYRIFRWVSAAGLIAGIILALRASPPPQIVIAPNASQQAEAKVHEFLSSAGQGTGRTLEMDQSELNGWLSENLALKRPQDSARIPNYQTPESLVSLAKQATGTRAFEDAPQQQAPSSVRDVKVELLEDSLRLYALFDLHGMDLSLELDGELLVRDGCVRLEPTGGRLGSLPLTAGMLQSISKRLFDAPENKEKLRLPPGILDMRIEHGQLVVTSR